MPSDDKSSITLSGNSTYLEMPSPTEGEQALPAFNAIWNVIKSWDVCAQDYYSGYCGANGSHVKLILDALATIADEDRYAVRVACQNCGVKDRIEIPVGIPVSERACPVCGCKKLERQFMSEAYRIS